MDKKLEWKFYGLAESNFVELNVICVESPGILSTFSKLTFRVAIYVTDRAFEGKSGHALVNLLKHVNTNESDKQREKRMRSMYTDKDEENLPPKYLDSLYATCAGSSLNADSKVSEHVGKLFADITLRPYQKQVSVVELKSRTGSFMYPMKALLWMLNRELQGLTPDEKRVMMLAYDLCGIDMSQNLDVQPVRLIMHNIVERSY